MLTLPYGMDPPEHNVYNMRTRFCIPRNAIPTKIRQSVRQSNMLSRVYLGNPFPCFASLAVCVRVCVCVPYRLSVPRQAPTACRPPACDGAICLQDEHVVAVGVEGRHSVVGVVAGDDSRNETAGTRPQGVGMTTAETAHPAVAIHTFMYCA